MSAATCVSPIAGSRWRRIFIALKTGRSGQPVQKDGGRLATGSGRTSPTFSRCAVSARYRSSIATVDCDLTPAEVRKRRRPPITRWGTYSPCGERQLLALDLDAEPRLVGERLQLALDVVRHALFDDEARAACPA